MIWNWKAPLLLLSLLLSTLITWNIALLILLIAFETILYLHYTKEKYSRCILVAVASWSRLGEIQDV